MFGSHRVASVRVRDKQTQRERERQKANGSFGVGLVLQNVQHPVIEVAMVP